jgi:hypothetical protein
VTSEIKTLSEGPNRTVRVCKGFLVNGYRFHINSRAENMATQGSGVVVTATTECYASARDRRPRVANVDYYGVLEKVIILDYGSKARVALMKCKWFDSLTGLGMKMDECGFRLINTEREHITTEPYIFASQANQVFYVKDPLNPEWSVAIKTMPRHIFDDPGQDVDYMQIDPLVGPNMDESLDDLSTIENWDRVDGDEEIVHGIMRDDINGEGDE